MKRILLGLVSAVALISFANAVDLQQYQPGPRLIDGSQLNKMVDVVNDLSAATANGVVGVASGYKAARGETALDGSNPTPVTTGLTTITGCSLTIKTTAAPGIGTSIITYSTSSGTLNMYAWKVTSSVDATLVASTGTETIGWICFGT